MFKNTMNQNNLFSDYGCSSGTSTESSLNSLDTWSSTQSPFRHGMAVRQPQHNSADFLNLVAKRDTLEDMMEDFKRNGFDSPYNPEEDKMSRQSGELLGMGPSSVYLRQKSWPEPEATPAVRLPRPKSEWITPTSLDYFTPAKKFCDDFGITTTPMSQLGKISAEQVRVLNSLPNAVLYGLLRDLEQDRNEARAKNMRGSEAQECRFCKNNGERESYYRSHVLKDINGRVSCPVLRKFVCKRCGARGDRAHTIKYCPLSTDEERFKSSAMMRSVRLASGRRRADALAHEPDYFMFGDTTPSVLRDLGHCAPLDPLWADLEQKLTF
ncbi:uncharacterized protein [Choristoneura fumiferana]|uniref:uncharacterized protein n=1 Tax=Choristoneura fumiferana TaxID=7141 RepID=UPI003D155BC8